MADYLSPVQLINIKYACVCMYIYDHSVSNIDVFLRGA